MTGPDLVSILLALLGSIFFVAGTAGLLRFPDIYTVLHALSKADNLGLGLVVLSLALRASSIGEVFKLFLIWFMAMAASGTTAHLIARRALRSGVCPIAGCPAAPPDGADRA